MTDQNRDSIQDLKLAAQLRARDVLSALGIHAAARGARGTIAVCDPMTPDTDPSLVIWTSMPGGISWKRYGSDAQGDVINLVSYLRGWWHLPHKGNSEATRWLADLLGVKRMSVAQREADCAQARQLERMRLARAKEARERDGRRAFAMWTRAQAIEGTRVEAYLNARGIDLGKLPVGPRGGNRTPSVLRYLPAHEHVDAEHRVTAWPCMIAACVDYACAPAEIRAVHRTWIALDGSSKAPVAPPRKCWPGFAGLVIPIWRGGSNLNVREAIACGLRETLLITEGIEDALTAATLCPHLRVWAAISLNNIGNVPLPECIDSVLVHRQDDWQSRGAVDAFRHATEELRAQGRPVEEFRAFGGAKDINEMVQS